MTTPLKKNLKPVSRIAAKKETYPEMEGKLLRLAPLAKQALILMGREVPEEKAS